jgi:hypothetical protein
MAFAVNGIIGTRWRQWGGADGAFGPATSPEEDAPGCRIILFRSADQSTPVVPSILGELI